MLDKVAFDTKLLLATTLLLLVREAKALLLSVVTTS
jgi:hypothetical protein